MRGLFVAYFLMKDVLREAGKLEEAVRTLNWYAITLSLIHIFPYTHNSLRIEYSANNYSKMQTALYSYRLSNGSEEGEWSEYSLSLIHI